LAEATYPKSFHGKEIVPMQGYSLRPLLTGKGTFPRRELFWEHEGNAAMRVGDEKLVREGLRGKWELFNLKSDRTEQNDLAAERPERVAELGKRWRQWAKSANVMPKPTKKQKK
jgi:arylsulfatase